ncbi:hypothetical protein SEA_NICEHOUSE_158 [Rhodococcus phage NiceHouse]|nr:hypothetical protein SEA_NICEHOUSE_158 [Rhodococcus phage NiceHouse]
MKIADRLFLYRLSFKDEPEQSDIDRLQALAQKLQT